METENHYYLVLEMVRGGDLMTHICNNKRLSEQEAQKYTRQIISAVEYLHSMGIVHRWMWDPVCGDLNHKWVSGYEKQAQFLLVLYPTGSIGS